MTLRPAQAARAIFSHLTDRHRNQNRRSEQTSITSPFPNIVHRQGARVSFFSSSLLLLPPIKEGWMIVDVCIDSSRTVGRQLSSRSQEEDLLTSEESLLVLDQLQVTYPPLVYRLHLTNTSITQGAIRLPRYINGSGTKCLSYTESFNDQSCCFATKEEEVFVVICYLFCGLFFHSAAQ